MSDYKQKDEMGWGVVLVVMGCIALFVSGIVGVCS
jgi:hypothetical protein